MQVLLFEDDSRLDLLPFTYTCPLFDLRVGIGTLREKWQRQLHQHPGSFVAGPRQAVFADYELDVPALFINGKFLPDEALLNLILEDLHEDEAVQTPQGELLAFRGLPREFQDLPAGHIRVDDLAHSHSFRIHDTSEPLAIRHFTDLFRLNGAILRRDFAELTAGRSSAPLKDPHTITYAPDNIFLEAGAQVKAAILNAEQGPIYLGKNAAVSEGAIIHGAHAIEANAVVQMGAKLRGDSTIGPWAKAGGEIANSVFQGYANKSHDGYLGNSVIGRWCNLGAGTNISNLKNNYSPIRAISYRNSQLVDTGLQFCGLMMGDHSKCGINTMFNTGTVVGVASNLFGGGFPPKWVPSFCWGGSDSGFQSHLLEHAIQTARRVMARRDIELSEAEENLLRKLFEETADSRKELI